MLQQLFLQCTPCLNEKTAVDGLVRHVVVLVARPGAFEPSSNLLGRPLQLELVGHDMSQHPMLDQFADFGAQRPIPCKLVGLAGTIAGLPAVTLYLATDRRR